ncbi:MAG: putative N-acetylmannosamine-6-phosphate 2-epimerase [Acidobacteriota bacterium]|nr:putative N-acetylmannosamine-6-phosphate 2-epimerase [Acidobacteriota bacterium]
MAGQSVASKVPVFERLQGKLIVSCQASDGEPLANLDALTRMAASVLRGGAAGLRAEGAERVAAFRTLTDVPIIGIVKTYDAAGEVYITPAFAAAQTLSDAGADVIALDCTRRRLTEQEPWPELIRRIHEELRLPVLADVATLQDGLGAEAAGADAVATTLYGYTAETKGAREVSWALVEALIKSVQVPVILEGHVTDPQEVKRAFEMGASAVVVGSAITRPQVITARFVGATRR